MKHIDIEFVNIQSHEHTKFYLEPGLNFILAEDNNVGKSTIFKVLVCAMQLPKVDAVTPDELIRGGCTSGRASFTVEGNTHTLWLFRSSGKTQAFFETTYSDGATVRSAGAPTELREALDIVMSDDGKVINFNDADSVQLIVQDTPKNDEVLARVLIDLRVENIKDNAVRLSQQLQQDYKIYQARLETAQYAVKSQHYCYAVDTFNQEKALLSTACSVLDVLEKSCSPLPSLPTLKDGSELVAMESASGLIQTLSTILECVHEGTPKITEEDVNIVDCACSVLVKLCEVSSNVPNVRLAGFSKSLSEVESIQDVLARLTRAVACMSDAFNASARMISIGKSMVEVEQSISELGAVKHVQCPIKGEVIYTDEKCIPVGD